MGFKKGLKAVFSKKGKNKKEKKNERKQQQERAAGRRTSSSETFTAESSSQSGSTPSPSLLALPPKRSFSDLMQNGLTRLYSISRGNLITPVNEQLQCLQSLEGYDLNKCRLLTDIRVPIRRIEPRWTPPRSVLLKPIARRDRIRSPVPSNPFVATPIRDLDDVISISSSIIDFEILTLQKEHPWTPEPALPRIFAFDINGNAFEEEAPPKIRYAFAEDNEKRYDIGEKLYVYRTEKEEKALAAQVSNNDRLIEGIPPPRKLTIGGETMEKYIENIRKHQTFWKKEDGKFVGEARIRRKLLDGSYPHFTVDEEKLSSLLRYVWKGKIDKVRNYLRDESKYEKINRQDRFGRTALHFAASWGDINIMNVLLQVPGINLNIKDANDMTPLFKAVEIKSYSCVKLLVNAGAKERITCRDDRNVLEYAIMEFGDDCYSMIEYLYLERGLHDAKSRETTCMTYLHQAAIARSHVSVTKVIEMMITNGADIDAMEGNGRTPLIVATMGDRPDVVYTLLNSFADMNHYDDFMKNAIRYAKEGSECFKVLQGCCGGDPFSRRLEYEPKGEQAEVSAVAIDNNKRLNPRMEDPEYRQHITNLFLATKFK